MTDETVTCDECGAELEQKTNPLGDSENRVGTLLDHYADEHPEHEIWKKQGRAEK